MSEEEIIDQDYNADDPAQVNRARKKAAREKIQHDEVIRGIMSVKEGRKWIHHIIQFCDVFGNPHVAGMPDATAFNCGMANAGKMVWAEVEEAAPEFCTLMLKEAKKYAKQQEE